MKCNFKAARYCGSVCREIIILTRRQFASKYHALAWLQYERTILYMWARSALFLVSALLEDLRNHEAA